MFFLCALLKHIHSWGFVLVVLYWLSECFSKMDNQSSSSSDGFFFSFPSGFCQCKDKHWCEHFCDSHVMREQKIASKSISLLWIVSLGKPKSRGRTQGCETRSNSGFANQKLQKFQCWWFLLMYWKEIYHEFLSGSQQHKSGGYVLKHSFQQFCILDVVISSHFQKAHFGPQCFAHQLKKKKKKSPKHQSWLSSMSWINSSFSTAVTELLRLEGPLDIL